MQRVARVRPPRCRSTPSRSCCRSAGEQRGSCARPAGRVGRPAAAQQRHEVAAGGARSSPPRTARGVLEPAADRALVLAQRQLRSNFAVSARRALDAAQRQARQLDSRLRLRSARRTSPGTAACVRSRGGCRTSTSLLERQVLVVLRLERRLRAPAPAAPQNVGSPDRSMRSASVLTKKPISPSTSGRVAVGHRRADHDVVPGRTAAPAAPGPGREQRHEQRRAVAPAQRAQPRASAPRRASSGRPRRRRRLCTPGAAGRSAAPAAPARRARRSRQYCDLRARAARPCSHARCQAA